METIYILLLLVCLALVLLLSRESCSSSRWLMAFLGFLSAYLGLILLDSQDFYISPTSYFVLLSICFLPGPIILGYVGHISTRVQVGARDFVFCLLPPMVALVCGDLLGGFGLFTLVDEQAYQAPTYLALFNLISALAGIHLLAYLSKALQLILRMRRDWSAYQSRTLPASWYDMIKVVVVIFVTNIAQVASAFIHPAGQAVSIGDIGFLILVGYFIYLAARTAMRNNQGAGEEELIVESEVEVLTEEVQPGQQEEYQHWADHIEQKMQQELYFLQEDLSLSSLAEQLDITPHRLSEVLNKYFVKSFYEYINDLRVKHAAGMLLQEPKRSIVDIYFEAGFTTKSTFYSHFKKTFQCTPTEYRKSAKEGLTAS